MNGTQRRNRTHPYGYTYYQCWPRANNRGRSDRYHRKAVYIREDALLDALTRFYADRVFGPHRAAALAADLGTLDDRAAAGRQTERERLQRTLADLTRRQNNLRRQAQDLEPGDPWAQGLREDYNALEKDKAAALAEVATLDAADATQPDRPHPDDVALLDVLPYLRLNLAHAPQPLLRTLFETTRLTIDLHEDSDDVTVTVTLPAVDLPAIVAAARAHSMPAEHPQQPDDQQEPRLSALVDAVCAPGRIRTCDLEIRSVALHANRCLYLLILLRSGSRH
jgi:site-specific DNA recombinase